MNTIIIGDALESLSKIPDQTVDCCVTSPPYFRLRDYRVKGQIGLEQTPDEYIKRLTDVFHEVRRVLKNDGTLWIVIADSYACSSKGAANYRPGIIKPKDLIGIPWMLAFALREDGWYLRSDIIWYKPNVMPESVKDRPTKTYEHVFLFAKQRRYYYDNESILVPAHYDGRKDTLNKGSLKYATVIVPGNNPQSQSVAGKPHERWRFRDGKPVKNRRDVWKISTRPYRAAHFATFPPELVEPCILAGSRVGGTVLDPFIGSGTTAEVAQRLGRHCIGIELNPEYKQLIDRRTGENQEGERGAK